ncbi:response regulator transcription factor [Sanyastnella coralliicola]|uniref:response regulator transcription factor n=1 Tax=Sanyastnella coralliicola TaxID=3069118 RepID=UPI0027BA804E|nr:response regulator transcription factor [Longitalea sp. SCSIO 12813]
MDNAKILLVDDEQDIIDLVKYNLEKENFEVHTANNGKEAIRIARKVMPDLILLDVMMPEMDGMETCQQIREIPELKGTLISFLTARGEDYSQIAGFDAGADDYITKPIKPRVLISRIKATLRRRAAMDENKKKKKSKGISIDKERYIVMKNGDELTLPKKEFELLSLLMSQPGRVFTRETILSSVWGNDVIVGDRTIDVHIRKLREKLGDHYFKTVKGVGYKFND